ncbi:hypothetical protein Syun_010546 [Stephania yunnanensis]|uniref:Protein FAR1-RELATED SEQUENCE n=1 Tax=Stephania yunnanensis TaxID=152371 RepID=A0AAP0KJ08_9MAGN
MGNLRSLTGCPDHRGALRNNRVLNWRNPITKMYSVAYLEDKEGIDCDCQSFDFRGILCCHALCVLKERDIMLVPLKYIMTRWRKDFGRAYE